MDTKTKREIISLLRQARKDGRKPFAGYIKEEDGSIHVLLLADASEFIYRQLKKFEPELLEMWQKRFPDQPITKVTVVPKIADKDAQATITLGGVFKVFRREKMKDRPRCERHLWLGQ